MKAMKKFFQTFGEDGSVTYRGHSNTDSAGIRITPDGLLYFGGLQDGTQHGSGVVFGGADVFVSHFESGSPQGESLMIQKGQVKRLLFNNGSINENELLDGEIGESFFDSFLGTGIVHEAVRRCELLPEINRLEWSEVIETGKIIDAITGVVHSTAGSVDLLGYMNDNPVLLTRLPSHPPTGHFEIGGGIRVREVDVWKRRLDKFFSSVDTPQRFTILRGFYRFEGNMYIVSSLPSNVEEFYLKAANTSHDCLVDVLFDVVRTLRELSNIRVAWNGLINRHSFITTTDGEVYLNTGYVLSQFTEQKKLYGGHSIEQIRYLSPNQLVRSCAQSKIVLECIGYSIPAPENVSRGELHNLGMLIYSLLRGDEGIPFPWLSDAQFVLVNWVAGVDPTNPLADLLSILCEEPVDIHDPHKVRQYRKENVDPLLRVADRLVNGSMTLDELFQSLESYMEWRDRQLVETSVETEVKAVFNKVSAFIQSGQEAMKSALTKSVENSW